VDFAHGTFLFVLGDLDFDVFVFAVMVSIGEG